MVKVQNSIPKITDIPGKILYPLRTMYKYIMTKTIPTATDLTADVCEMMGIDSYNPDELYTNPLKNAKIGKHYNWDNSDSGFLPKNTVNAILAGNSVIEGIAIVSKQAQEEFELDTGYSVDTEEMIGIIEEISIRFGRGAAAEKHVTEFLKNQTNKKVIDAKQNDEKNRVDIRCKTAVFQVKLSGVVADNAADAGYRTDWKKPKAKAVNNEDRELIWVTNNGKIFKKLDKGRVMEGWERLD